jgi:hypothetical protein
VTRCRSADLVITGEGPDEQSLHGKVVSRRGRRSGVPVVVAGQSLLPPAQWRAAGIAWSRRWSSERSTPGGHCPGCTIGEQVGPTAAAVEVRSGAVGCDRYRRVTVKWPHGY